jgi:hypothetical protein
MGNMCSDYTHMATHISTVLSTYQCVFFFLSGVRLSPRCLVYTTDYWAIERAVSHAHADNVIIYVYGLCHPCSSLQWREKLFFLLVIIEH